MRVYATIPQSIGPTRIGNLLFVDILPANGNAREDETASPGIKVSSPTSIPRRSKSKLAPKANLVFNDDISSLTAAQRRLLNSLIVEYLLIQIDNKLKP